VNAFRRLAEIRRWSWLVKFNQFIAPTVYSTGSVSVTNGSTTVTGSGTTWTGAMVGRQFRVGLAAPIYTVAQFTSATSIELDLPFGGPTSSGSSYGIYQCYFTPPEDFHQFITLWDPAFNWQLWLDVQQQEINIWDAQRSNTGNAFVVSFRGYTGSQVGVVAEPLQVSGSGNAPLSGGVFNGPSDATFTVEVTTTGAPGTAVYKWKKGSGSYTTGVTTDSLGQAQQLMDGVVVAFPIGVSYTSGDIFIINCTALSNAGLPFYELWPHQQAQHVYPFLYEIRARDLDDVNAVLPRYIRGDVLVEMALEDVCLWPGPSVDKPNPYYSLSGAKYHADRLRNDRGNGMLDVLEVQDDNVWEQNLTYSYPSMLWGFATPLGDAAWLQSHAI
jgi:hypothetical protein